MLKGGVNMWVKMMRNQKKIELKEFNIKENVAQQIQSLQDELKKNELNIETTMQVVNKMKKENQQIKKIIKTLEKFQEDQ